MDAQLLSTFLVIPAGENPTCDEQMWEDIDTNECVCIFCDRKYLWRKGVNQKLTKVAAETKKKHILEILKHLKQQSKIEQIQCSGSVHYHLTCFAVNSHRLRNAIKSVKVPSTQRKIHAFALSKIKENIVSTVINNSEVQSLREIHQAYEAFFHENETTYEPIFTPHYLLKQLSKSLPNLTKTVFKNRTYIHRNDLSVKEVYEKGFPQNVDQIMQIKKIAYEIRNIVKGIKKRDLPKQNLTVKDIVEGECDIPKELYVLIASLVQGPKKFDLAKDIKISSICSSLLYVMSNGSIKHSACLSLGLTVKSLTSSRKMLNILNKMGFTINYSLAEEIETELAYGFTSENRILPYGLSPHCPELSTHLAFDNFDRFVETSSGKDTLHDTVGIVYQNKET